jgi:hypothetical protein
VGGGAEEVTGAPPSRDAGSERSNRWLAILAIVVCAVACGIGTALTFPQRAVDEVTVDGIAFAIPPGWHSITAPAFSSVLGLTDPATYAPKSPAAGAIVVGSAPGVGRLLLAPGARARIEGQPATSTWQLDRYAAQRLSELQLEDTTASLTAFEIPTAESIAMVICVEGTGSGAEAAATACRQAAGTVRLTDARPVALGTRSHEATTFQRVLEHYAKGRSGARKRLAGTPREGRARIADELAAAAASAAGKLNDVSVDPRLRSTQDLVVTALERAGAAYRQLAVAVEKGRSRTYGRASVKIAAADRALKVAVDRLPR